jgi:molybdopterin synthase sulfur carrier subunit
MPRVGIPTGLADEFTNGTTELDAEATNVRGLVLALEARYPGLGKAIDEEMAIAIDGNIYQDGFIQKIREDSEVYFLPKISGGSAL